MPATFHYPILTKTLKLLYRLQFFFYKRDKEYKYLQKIS